ncbi:LysR family transcriptional regulator [Nonomuraea typhae]|uniref:LysR family transcriptional regulator n=1 Tax=Nonomuraea typhae TaxID=2603600 RepID=A0ABW7Z2J7_9ACTN
MELEVRHLRVVCAIADTGSISKAATSLGMSQPALAAQLRRIERQFGGPLFERGREGTTPTPLGRWLLLRSRSVLPAFDDLARDARRHARDDRDTIRVGCALTRLAIFAAKALRRLLPEAEISLRTEETTEVLPGLLESERIELATLDDYPGHELQPPPGAIYAEIAVEPVFVGLTASHPLAAHDEINLADLAKEQWAQHALLETGPREHFWTACADHGFAPMVGFKVDLSVALDLIAEGRCVGLFQATSPARDGIVIRPIAGSPLRMRHLIGWTEHGPLAPHSKDLVQAVTKTYWSEAMRNPTYNAWLRRHGAHSVTL